jgi:four helix bundle protein
MGAKTFRELRAWQRADALRREVIALTATPSVKADRNYCDSLRKTTSSVCRNLAEGFARFSRIEFAHAVRIALGSLAEVQDHLIEARANGYVTETRHDELQDLAEHAKATMTRLLKYLKKPRDRGPDRPSPGVVNGT